MNIAKLIYFKRQETRIMIFYTVCDFDTIRYVDFGMILTVRLYAISIVR